MAASKKVRKETFFALIEKTGSQIEIRGSWAREVGDTKWVSWFVLYQRLHRKQIRKNKLKGVE